MTTDPSHTGGDSPFRSARRYDLGVNWDARLAREVPLLTEVFGPPAEGGILDAGCGPGHQARALAAKGYRVIGLDAEKEMIDLAKQTDQPTGPDSSRCHPVHWIHAQYSQLPGVLETAASVSNRSQPALDGALCLGNALAAAGDQQRCQQAVQNLAAVLRPEGRLFIQILNFRAMRDESPCVRGPRVAVNDGIEYVSVRHFTFAERACDVTNVTLWNDGKWRCSSHTGRLYPIDYDELMKWCSDAQLTVDACYRGYAKDPFDIRLPGDLIVVATRMGGA